MVYLTFAFLTMTLSILFCTFNKSFNHRQRKIMWLGFVFILAFLCSMIEPKPIYDLYRYYIDLDSIKLSGVDFKDFVLGDIIVTDNNYRYSFTYNFITYIISTYMPKETLPFFAICFCYGCVTYVFEDVYKQEDAHNYKIVLTILLSFSVLPLLYVYSNIRTAVAMSMMALALYMKIFKGKSVLYFLTISFLATTIHPVALAVVPFLFLSKINIGRISVICIGVLPFLTNYIMELFQFANNNYLRYIGIKYYNYVFVEVYSQGNIFYYTQLLMVLTILMVLLIDNTELDVSDVQIKNFIIWYSIFVISCMQSYQLILRLPFMFGVLSPIIVKYMILICQGRGLKRILGLSILITVSIVAIGALINNFLWLL